MEQLINNQMNIQLDDNKKNGLLYKTVNEELYGKLLVYVDEDDRIIPRGDIHGSNNHQPLLYDLFKDKDSSLNSSDHIHMMLSKYSQKKDFLIFLNSTNYQYSDKCNVVVVYSTSRLTSTQRRIAFNCLKQLEKDNVYTEIGLYENGVFSVKSKDDYFDLISSDYNSIENKHVKILKRQIS